MMGMQRDQMSARTKAGAKWLSKVKKGQVAPKDSVALSVVHLSPLGSQLSFASTTMRIENVTDWESIAKKYRALMGEAEEVRDTADEEGNEDEENSEVAQQAAAPAVPVA